MAMEIKSGSWLSVTGLLGTSLLIHGAIFVSLRPVGRLNEAAIAQFREKAEPQKKEKLEFEFVEAPPKRHPQSPRKAARKISDRDALNQDLTKDKSKAEGLPAIKNVELTDQLTQRPFQPPKNPFVESQPSNRHPEVAEAAEGSQKKDSSATTLPQNDELRTPHDDTRPKSEAQTPLQGLTGQDRITTQETAKMKSGGARLYGVTSFEATGSGMGVYMKNLKEKIWLAWYPYLAFHYPQDYRGADAVVSILLDKKGDVKIVRLVESQGSTLFASYCLEAVQKASSFGPLPEEILALIGKDELELKFGFHYR